MVDTFFMTMAIQRLFIYKITDFLRDFFAQNRLFADVFIEKSETLRRFFFGKERLCYTFY